MMTAYSQVRASAFQMKKRRFGEGDQIQMFDPPFVLHKDDEAPIVPIGPTAPCFLTIHTFMAGCLR